MRAPAVILLLILCAGGNQGWACSAGHQPLQSRTARKLAQEILTPIPAATPGCGVARCAQCSANDPYICARCEAGHVLDANKQCQYNCSKGWGRYAVTEVNLDVQPMVSTEWRCLKCTFTTLGNQIGIGGRDKCSYCPPNEVPNFDNSTCIGAAITSVLPKPSDPDLSAAVDRVNAYRRQHGARALEWNVTLAVAAQQLASSCPSNSSRGDPSTVDNVVSCVTNYTTAVDGWYNQGYAVNYSTLTSVEPKDFDALGQFLPMIWKGAVSIGMGSYSGCPVQGPDDCKLRFAVKMYISPGAGGAVDNVLPRQKLLV